jgi:hypothetical protein
VKRGFTVPGLAIVRAPIAPMYSEPHVASIQISQRLAGHDVELLEEQDDWFLSRGIDGYEGWIHRGFLSDAASPSENGVRISLGCVTQSAGNGRRALPLGARLSPEEELRSGEAIDQSELASRFPRQAVAITGSADVLFEGTPYLWGGVTPWGADCSGFVQTIFGLHGVHLPRDAWQQSETGNDAGKLDDLQPADLAFFTDREDRRVTHVAIAAGERRLIHVALGRGGFARETLANTTDGYVMKLRERFLKSKRVL